ncbi:MAG: SDR family NAD(P)-dependent oxidoreductase [Pirellulales bacterium]|nr:SDR family NAD(P)-dependent oxidoreductase [Pirellulales bacterium]
MVLVTGGSSGLGRMIAQAYYDAGVEVAIAALEDDAVRLAAEEMSTNDRKVLGLQADLTCQNDVDRVFEQVIERFGRLDVLVNNAGRTDRGKVLDTSPEQFQRVFELNFLATVRCTRAAVPHLLKHEGHVVNIGSLAAKSAARWIGAYPVSKFAVAAYSQQLRLELGDSGLHVLLVCPGPVARKNERLYPLEGTEDIPESARRPGAGVKTKAIDPEWLASAVLRACERRRSELVVPGKARILFAISALWPRLGDWIVLHKT